MHKVLGLIAYSITDIVVEFFFFFLKSHFTREDTIKNFPNLKTVLYFEIVL